MGHGYSLELNQPSRIKGGRQTSKKDKYKLRQTSKKDKYKSSLNDINKRIDEINKKIRDESDKKIINEYEESKKDLQDEIIQLKFKRFQSLNPLDDNNKDEINVKLKIELVSTDKLLS